MMTTRSVSDMHQRGEIGAREAVDLQESVRRAHRHAAHRGDREGFYDCAACGVIEARLDHYRRLVRQETPA